MRNFRRMVVFGLIFLIIPFLNFSQSENPAKPGYQEYIEFLKANRDKLNYNTYGLIEGTDTVVIKIYGNREIQDQIMESLDNFDVLRHQVEEFTEGQVVISIYFPLPKPMEPAEKAVEEPVAVKQKPVKVREQETKETKCPRRVKVQARLIEPQLFSEYRYFQQPIRYDQDVNVSAELTARVREVLVAAGDHVQQGQILVRLDSTVLEKEIASVEALLKKWKNILWQRQHWKERSPVSEKQAEDQIRDTEALLGDKMNELSKTQIKAPFDGKIVYAVSVNEPLETGAIVLRIVSDRMMKISVPPVDAGYFHSGQVIKVVTEAMEGSLSGTVSVTEQETKIVLDNSDLSLSEGIQAGFRVLVKEHSDALVIYEKEVLRDEAGYFTYVVNGKTCQRRSVEISPFLDGEALIQSGLNPGDEVIVSGFECLKDGKKIKVMVWDEAKGKLRARKKKERIEAKRVEPEKIIEVPVIPVEKEIVRRKNFWAVGAGLGGFLITDNVFTDVYGSITPAGFLTVSFTLKEKIEFFFSALYSTASGEFTGGLGEKTTLTMTPLYLGAKLVFKKIKKLLPYAGAAVVRFNIKEAVPASDEIHESTNYRSNFGASVFAGSILPLGKKLDLFFQLMYDICRIPVDDEGIEKINLSGLRLLVGLRMTFGR